jgi:MoxR-like ATPase
MPPMSLVLLASREAVLQAISEFDELGREGFLSKYGYGPARGYFLEHEGRFYDSKAIVGAAVGFEHPERGPLKRTEFSGGEDTVRPKLQELGFDVVSYASREGHSRRLWWVNQGATFDAERAGGYVWAPQRSQAGRLVGHHQNVAQLATGDLIFHYAKGLVRAISVVRSAREEPRPAELPTEQWTREGYLAEVAYHDAPTPIALEEIPASWRTDDGGPFTRHGSVKQGYLYPLSSRFVTRLTDEFGSRWPDLRELVGQSDDREALAEFIRWGRKFYEWGGFEENERTYKLTLAAELALARRAFTSGGDWRATLHGAIGHRDNNLLPWQVSQRLTAWVDTDPLAADAFSALWGAGEPLERARAFLEVLPAEVVSGRGIRTAVASFFLMAEDATAFPIYRPTPIEKAYDLAGYRKPAAGADETALYEHALAFFDLVVGDAASRGLQLRDRLDAQGIIWALTKSASSEAPIIEWPQPEQEAFLRWRGDLPVFTEPDGLEGLARSLLLDVEYLREIERLIRDKGQVIFYGPPGTGKTYVARQLALHFAGSSDRVKLVQFHPSYAYEDFVEGYRPQEVNGQPGFGLVRGPFAAIADAARESPDDLFVLIIDEVNRGNVAKVFGELYFLLEYRDEAINLLYSASEFRLPSNLWLIGTMNTADRSIALLDAALRRRFYFIPFFPDKPPIAGLLRRWLDQNKPGLEWVADVVDRANSLLGDRNVGIGPSYFMRANLTEEWVGLIWEHAIMPYLAEQFFGEEERLTEFNLDRLRFGATLEDTDSADGSTDPAP